MICKVATLADFFGTRWTVNAVMLGGPNQSVYLMPAGRIAQFFRQYSGAQGIDIPASTGSLELSASRNDKELFVHVVNTDLHDDCALEVTVGQDDIAAARLLEIAPGDLSAYVDHQHVDTFAATEHDLTPTGNCVDVKIAAASVAVLVITLA